MRPKATPSKSAFMPRTHTMISARARAASMTASSLPICASRRGSARTSRSRRSMIRCLRSSSCMAEIAPMRSQRCSGRLRRRESMASRRTFPIFLRFSRARTIRQDVSIRRCSTASCRRNHISKCSTAACSRRCRMRTAGSVIGRSACRPAVRWTATASASATACSGMKTTRQASSSRCAAAASASARARPSC